MPDRSCPPPAEKSRTDPAMLRSSHALVAVLAIALPIRRHQLPRHSPSRANTRSRSSVSRSRDRRSQATMRTAPTRSKAACRAAGLAKLFDDTRGTISSKGTISGKKMVPQAFRADYTSGKKASVVDIRFANGAVDLDAGHPGAGQARPQELGAARRQRPGCRCSIRWPPPSSMPTASTRSAAAR